MKQNSCSIVSEVAKPSGVGLDELDRAIESFGTSIADSVAAIVKQTLLMPPEHLDHFLDRFQTTAHRIVRRRRLSASRFFTTESGCIQRSVTSRPHSSCRTGG